MFSIRSAATAVFASVFVVPVATAAEQWLKLKSSHFELYTTAGERKGREAILFFEQVRDFFSKALTRSKSSSAAPVRIVAFRSEKEYKPFRPNEFATAFYLAGYDRDYIVMESISPEHYPVAVHEFTHLLVRRSGVEAPVWFNEGLAELYSTLKPFGKKVKIGDLIPGRVIVLRQNKWLPIETLLAVDQDSPYYNERDRAGVFYAESWALIHMLTLSDQYRQQYTKFATLLSSGLPGVSAFWQAYAKTPAQVQKDLDQYLHGTSFNAVLFNINLQKSDEDPDIEPAPPLESGMVLADLFALSDKKEDARQKYESVAKEFPQSWEPEAGLAELAWREFDITAARRHFARAAELGSKNPRMYYDYANVLQRDGEKDEALVRVLSKAVELDPDYQEAHRYLAFCLLQTGNYEEAVNHFSKVNTMKREEAFSYYHGLAYANYRLEKRDAAKKAAEAARKFARRPGEIAQAEELLRVIEERGNAQVIQRTIEAEPRAQVASAPGAARQEPSEAKPRLVRRPDDQERAHPAAAAQAAWLTVQGKLRQVDCLGKIVRLRVLSDQKEVALAIDDPQTVAVKGSAKGTLDLICGPQKVRSVTLEYESRPDAKLGTIGIVHSIEFQ